MGPSEEPGLRPAGRGGRSDGRVGHPGAEAALASSVAVVLVTFVAFPGVPGTASFLGSEGRLAWGPRVGWFLVLFAAALLAASLALGWRLDRLFRGRCWKCLREVAGDRCDYCEAAQ